MKQKMIVAFAAFASIAATPGVTFAQNAPPKEAIASSDVLSQISMFSYREGPKSDLYFRGTPIAANATGKARVEYQDNNAEIRAEARDLPEPASLGPYTAYVLWTITPDGRATNQGVLVGVEGGKGKMETQHGTSQFALIVTAEPHFAVTVPSSMIALYNVADKVKGVETKVTTLTERSDYSNLAPIGPVGKTTPLEVVQARYSVAIARTARAERFAPRDFAMATAKLAAAETALRGKKRSERNTAPGLAREAIVAGEGARRAAMIASAASATERQRLAAASAATQAANEVAAEAASKAATAAAAASRAQRQRSATAARIDLLNRLNAALPTRQSDRGLVSEIGGVQFSIGAADINATAREGLSRFSGIVASYPGLRFDIEGHTDSTGSVATNNALSSQRAMAVRDFLLGQGVAASSIDVAGFGSSRPIADNSTTAGRADNRRVEIVLSGGPLPASR